MNKSLFRVCNILLGWSAISLFAPAASAVCPSGDLLPDLRALPARDVAVVLDAQGQPTGWMKFSTTSWNSGGGSLELVTKEIDTGASKQRVDQRIRCKDGTYVDRGAGFFEYHAAPDHNHVHFNDYANYILEPLDANPQNIRKGTKTTFCIIDTTNINTQLIRAASSPVYSACASQVYGSKQGMSVGWGDTYGSYLEGQSIYTGDLPPGRYRLRIVIDPKDQLLEISNGNNESCKLVEIGFGYVADMGLCVNPPPQPKLYAIDHMLPYPTSQGTCPTVTITGDNLAPEMRMSFLYGTGPLPAARNVEFPDAATVTATVCVPKSPGKKPRLGNDPVWDLFSGNPTLPHVGSATLPNAFRVW